MIARLNSHPKESTVSKSQKSGFDWSDSDEERPEYWVRISAVCCHSNEVTAYTTVHLYEKNLKLENVGKLTPTVFPFYQSTL